MVTKRHPVVASMITVAFLGLPGCSGDDDSSTETGASTHVGDSVESHAVAPPGEPARDTDEGTSRVTEADVAAERTTARPSIEERLRRVSELAAAEGGPDEAISLLVRTLGDPDVEVRQSAEDAISALAGRGNSLLLVFSRSGQEDSNAMKPLIAKLREEGLPLHVEYFSYGGDDSLQEDYRVEEFPTFVALVNGREVDRRSGVLTEEPLRRLASLVPPRPEVDEPSLETRVLVALLERSAHDPWIAREGQRTLRELGGSAVDQLHDFGANRELPDRVRVAAVLSLGNLSREHVEKGVEALEAIANDEDESFPLRVAAAAAILVPDSEPGVQRVLVMALRDPRTDAELRRLAASRLAETPHDAGVAALASAALDRDPEVAATAVESLAAIGDAAVPAIPALFSAHARADYSTSYRIRTAMEELADGLDTLPDSILDELRSGDPERIELAANLCRRIGDLTAAKPVLEKMLAEGDEELRIVAAEMLSRMPQGDARSLEFALDSLLADPDSDYRARRVVTGAGSKAITLLLGKLEGDDLDDDQRAVIVRMFGSFYEGTERAVPKLLPLLDSEHDELQLAAAITLSGMGTSDERIAGILLEGLKTGDEDRRRECARGLADVTANEEVADALLAALDDPSRGVRYSAANSLSDMVQESHVEELRKRLGDPEQAPHVLTALSGAGPLAAGCMKELLEIVKTNEELADSAASVLARIGDEAVPSLGALLTDDTPSGIRVHALEALSQVGEAAQSTEESLVACLAAEDVAVKVRAAAILASLGSQDERLPGTLVVGLTGDDRQLVYAASSGLSSLGEQAAVVIPQLLELLRAEDPSVAQLAASVLSNVGAQSEEAAGAYLEYVVSASDPEQRRSRAYGLSQFGERVAPKLLTMLDEDDDERRTLAASLVVGIAGRLSYGDDEALRGRVRTKLLAKLDDESEPVQQFCAVAVSVFDPPPERVVPILVKGLDSDDERVVEGSLQAISRIGGPAAVAVPRLLELVEDDEHGYSAANALSSMEGAVTKSIDKIVPLLDDPDTFPIAANLVASAGEEGAVAFTRLKKGLDDERMLYPAVNALLAIGDTAIPVVEELAGRLDDETRRYNACRALGMLAELDPETAEDALREALRSDDVELRGIAAEGLSELLVESDETRKALLAALDDDSMTVRRGAISALAQFGEQASEAVPKLTESLEHETLRYVAVGTLATMGEAARPAMPKLAEMLEKDADFASSVVYSLGTFGEMAKPCSPALLKLVERQPDYREPVRRVLLQIDPDAAKKLSSDE